MLKPCSRLFGGGVDGNVIVTVVFFGLLFMPVAVVGGCDAAGTETQLIPFGLLGTLIWCIGTERTGDVVVESNDSPMAA